GALVVSNNTINVATGQTLQSSGGTIVATSANSVAAGNITGQVLGANGGTGVANTGKTITLGGNLTTSGASNLTLTTTGATTVTLPTSGTLVGSADSGTVTNTMLAGSIANAKLANSTITIAGTSTALGGTITLDTITGVSSNGLLKRTAANTLAAAISGTDYAPATSGSSILYGNGSGGFSSVTVGGNLSFTGGTLNLGATPNIQAATGTSLALTGNFSSAGSSAVLGSFVTIGGGGQTSLPAATGAGLFLDSASSTKRVFFGDGSGYSLAFASRTGSATTDRFTLTDTGAATLAANLTVSGGSASTNTGSGALVLSGSGGLGVGGNVNVGGNLAVAGPTSLNGNGNPIKGTTTNDSAAAGYIGEFFSANLASGSAVSLTSPSASNIVSLSLTAGDWDVQGLAAFVAGVGTTVTQTTSGISTTSGVVSTSTATIINGGVPASLSASYPTVTVRISIASTTTVYLVSAGVFSGGTLGGYGFITARRVR
ncbi:MAG TPA: hypothetical protein VGE76_10900, partial [Opitutaceae bacterium]